MAIPSSKLPDIPGSGYHQMPISQARRALVQVSKEDQRRERNRQAQRRHREFFCYSLLAQFHLVSKPHLGSAGESVKHRLEKYDRLRHSSQDPENGINPSTHLADLPIAQQRFCPSRSASVNPFMHSPSMLPSLFPEVEVDQPIDPLFAETNDPLSHLFLPSAEYAKGVYSPPSTAHYGNSSPVSSRVEEHSSVVFTPPLFLSSLIF